jgi:hypothetical protein
MNKLKEKNNNNVNYYIDTINNLKEQISEHKESIYH